MFNAFSSPYFGRVLRSQCGVCQAITAQQLQQGVTHPPIKEFRAIWDTGATSSAIAPNVVKALNLQPIGMCKNSTAAGIIDANVYLVNIILPNNVGVPMLRVSENDLNDTDVLIGMDVISQGDFSVSLHKGSGQFSFQIPHSHDIDYVAELNKIEKIHLSWAKSGNMRCPCNSGKQWQNCHGKR